MPSCAVIPPWYFGLQFLRKVPAHFDFVALLFEDFWFAIIVEVWFVDPGVDPTCAWPAVLML